MGNNKVLITGSAGFIGSHLTERCIEKGYNVVLVSYEELFSSDKGYEKLFTDIGLEVDANVKGLYERLFNKNKELESMRGCDLDSLQKYEILNGVDYDNYLLLRSKYLSQD